MRGIETQFESIAEQYAMHANDEETSRYELKVNWPSLVAMLPATPSKILDYGCGNGSYGRLLLEEGYDVTFADNSPGMIRYLEDVKEKTHLWSYRDQPLPEVFDGVVAKLVVQFVDDLPSFAEAMRGQLRDGGRLVVSVPHPLKSQRLAKQQHSTREYTDEVSASGLEVTMIHRDFDEYELVMKAARLRFKKADAPIDPREMHSPPIRLNMMFEAV